MGIYSEIVSSCDQFGTELIGYFQTKDLQSVFDLYWIAKDGTLYRICWPSPEVEIDPSLGPFQRAQFPVRGAVTPYRLTGCINLIGGSPRGLAPTRGFMCFKEGRLWASGTS